MAKEPRFEKRDAFRVIGMLERVEPFSDEIPKLWERFMARVHEIQGRTEPLVSYGVEWDMDSEGNTFNYLTGVAVDADAPIPEGLTEVHVPPYEYAVFDFQFAEHQKMIEYIFVEWLSTSGYKNSSGLDLEVRDERFDPDAGKHEISIYLQVVKA